MRNFLFSVLFSVICINGFCAESDLKALDTDGLKAKWLDEIVAMQSEQEILQTAQARFQQKSQEFQVTIKSIQTELREKTIEHNREIDNKPSVKEDKPK